MPYPQLRFLSLRKRDPVQHRRAVAIILNRCLQHRLEYQLSVFSLQGRLQLHRGGKQLKRYGAETR